MEKNKIHVPNHRPEIVQWLSENRENQSYPLINALSYQYEASRHLRLIPKNKTRNLGSLFVDGYMCLTTFNIP